MDKSQFVRDMMVAALEAYKVTPTFNPVVAVAQACLESGFGTSALFKGANNIKGVKAGSSWKGDVLLLPTKEFNSATGEWYTTTARWRKYPNFVEAFIDYGNLIARVYPAAAKFGNDWDSFLQAILAGNPYRYATDPDYFNKVARIIAQYDIIELFKNGQRPTYHTLVIENSRIFQLEDKDDKFNYRVVQRGSFLLSVDGKPLEIEGDRIDIRFL